MYDRETAGEGTRLRSVTNVFGRVATGAEPVVRPRGGVWTITLPAQVGADCLRAIQTGGERALASGSTAIAIDLTATQPIDTQALWELSLWLRRFSSAASVAIVGADARVRWVIAHCEIEGVQLHASMRRALSDLRGSRRARDAKGGLGRFSALRRPSL